MDVFACLEPDGYIQVNPGDRTAVGSGLFFEIPNGYYITLRPRSGLALRRGITLANSPAVIDADYRGELQVLLVNHGDEPVRIEHGDRIAQLFLEQVQTFQWREVETLSDTERGSGGFGSTGGAATLTPAV